VELALELLVLVSFEEEERWLISLALVQLVLVVVAVEEPWERLSALWVLLPVLALVLELRLIGMRRLFLHS
jgi:hypothetical protein